MVNTNPQKIEEILNRGTIVEILPSKDEFKKILLSGKKLRFYIGFDATSPDLHLSHAKNIMLMEKFRQLGHETIILFGDFTARIGDPSDENSARKQLSKKQVDDNVKKWKQLIKPLMNFNDFINVYDPNRTSNFMETFDVVGTPVIYLLDENKRIIAKKINVETLEKLLVYFVNRKQK